MNYYTSDLHLGHANIIKLSRRPFSDVEEMNHTLLGNWNERVHCDDHVFIVGDFSFRSACPVVKYIEQLKGRKHLIIGNHDKKWLKRIEPSNYFESVEMMLELNDGERNLVLCHYPMMSWPGKNSYLLYGHIHNNKPASYWPLLKTYQRALNVSVEVNDYRPVTFDELVTNNERWRNQGDGIF